ncbi:MAG: radical SAM protein [Candidatus Heimdallarchaeota archaeon]|nr:radical SAM protein [Candidatus Heimdallarchaeota archaeon]
MWSLLRKDVMTVWQQVELKERLVRYREIFQGKRIPRYKLARLFFVPFDEYKDRGELLDIHEHYHTKFKAWLEEKQSLPLEKVEQEVYTKHTETEIVNNNYLKLKSIILNDILSSCEFCETRCKTNRSEGKVGKCGVDGEAYVSSSFIHMGEESPIIPSGTIFFYGCTIDCQFCQNWDISHEFDLQRFKGRGTSSVELASMFYSLVKQNARNINFVGGEPTPNLHVIFEALLITQVDVPMLWNSNMYLTETSMKLISDIFDIWLPDMKYSNNECASKYSKAPVYWDALKRNMKMIEQRGSGEYVIRHLVMPSHTKCCSLPILDWVNENLKTPLINIMAQYHPDYKVLQTDRFPEIGRRVSTGEMHEVRSYADKLGLYWKSVS